jgi:hypothetical protein
MWGFSGISPSVTEVAWILWKKDLSWVHLHYNKLSTRRPSQPVTPFTTVVIITNCVQAPTSTFISTTANIETADTLNSTAEHQGASTNRSSRFGTARISPINGIIASVSEEIDAASKPDRILAYKSFKTRLVVTSAIEIQTRSIVFT